MERKIKTLFDYVKNLCEPDLERIIGFVLGIVSASQQPTDRPYCPYCSSSSAILSGTAELDETFVLDCYKGASVPESTRRDTQHRHGAKPSRVGCISQ